MQCSVGQVFGQNYNPLYSESGLAGHPGIDVACGWNSPIEAYYDGQVSMVWMPENTPASDGYTCVNITVDDGIELFEWQIGHCRPQVYPGQHVGAHEVVGVEQNHGPVFSGNAQITIAQQKAGNQSGHHRHYQKRPLQPDTKTAWEPNNGYKGCIDPTKPVFQRDLWLGSRGYDVFVLQRYLKRHGFFTYPTCTGYYGPATATALTRFQRATGITPTIGYFGPKTRGTIIPLMPTRLFVPPASV